MSLLVGRSIAYNEVGTISAPRLALRSCGQGGTASPLIWAIAYDPVVEILSRSLRVPTPTFVDDLAALLRGLAMTDLFQTLISALSHAAGLYAPARSCVSVTLGPAETEGLWVVAWPCSSLRSIL